MTKHDNFEVNFSLRGAAAIQIGIYFLITVYCLQSILQGFLIDDNIAGMLSVEIIEGIGFGLLILFFLLSGMALFFKAKRRSKTFQFKIWNAKTKKTASIVLSSVFVILLLVNTALNMGYIDAIAPVFLLCYGALLLALHNKQRSGLLLVAGICLLLTITCLVIPSYWYSSFLILGIAHITYGIMIKS